MKELEVEFGGEILRINNFRSVYWPKEQALILSDLHLGKSAHFRSYGIPISQKVSEKDVQRLQYLVDHYQPRLLIIVGDLIHAGINADFIDFQSWLQLQNELQVLLIKGNHDRISNIEILKMGVQAIENTYFLPPFFFSHTPLEHQHKYIISGHIHPGKQIKLPTQKYLRLPSFILSENNLILPAFSEFTGLDTLNHPKDCTYYVFTSSDLFKL